MGAFIVVVVGGEGIRDSKGEWRSHCHFIAGNVALRDGRHSCRFGRGGWSRNVRAAQQCSDSFVVIVFVVVVFVDVVCCFRLISFSISSYISSFISFRSRVVVVVSATEQDFRFGRAAGDANNDGRQTILLSFAMND